MTNENGVFESERMRTSTIAKGDLRGKRVIESNPHIRRNFRLHNQEIWKVFRSSQFLSVSGVDQRNFNNGHYKTIKKKKKKK
jgi:hypothetical protein